eukprot:gene15600-biopygen3250
MHVWVLFGSSENAIARVLVWASNRADPPGSVPSEDPKSTHTSTHGLENQCHLGIPRAPTHQYMASRISAIWVSQEHPIMQGLELERALEPATAAAAAAASAMLRCDRRRNRTSAKRVSVMI